MRQFNGIFFSNICSFKEFVRANDLAFKSFVGL